jgi:hypothetical protein
MFWSKRACSFASIVVLASAFLGLNACDDGSGDSSSTFTVGGSVSGLDSGDKVVLLNNGGDGLTMSANSNFTFSSPVSANGSYNVIVETQPTGQVCTVSKGGGAGVTANISSVAVTCSTDMYIISGSVSGLPAGAKVVLENNGSDSLTIAADGVFKFATPAAYNGSYAVTVTTQPAGATCTVTSGVGAGITGSISNVTVNCSSNTVAIGGTISGLTTGQQVTLDDNGGDPLTLTANGVFTFSTQVADQGSYNVTVGTQPVAQTCTVVGGSGNHVTSPVSNVAVTCSADSYTVGGTVVGLAGGTQVTLDNNGADALTLTGNGTFTFTTPVAYDGAYAVTVGTQPTGQQTCTVSNASGTLVTANVTNIGINCVLSTPVSFTTPGSYTWTVPTGATSIQVLATGGGGGGGGAYQSTPSGPGGAGAIVTGTVPVTAGQVLNLVVGGGGGSGANPGQACAPGGGGGGSTNVDAGAVTQVIAGGGGGGGGLGNGCGSSSAGGDAGGPSGAGGNSAGPYGGGGGSGGVGGAGYGGTGNGGSGNGGAGGAGGNNGPQIPGGTGGSGIGAGAGASNSSSNALNGGGGGGYGGGGYGGTGGGAGGSIGPAGTTYAPASNAGAPGANGGDGSIVITPQ